MKWCRIETPNGPSFGVVDNESVELVDGTLFNNFAKMGKTIS